LIKLVDDFDQDGNLDILAVGNFYSGEVFSGQYDASIGWFLKGDGQGSFSSRAVSESGFFVDGDAKSMIRLDVNGKETVVTAVNNGYLKSHTSERVIAVDYQIKMADIFATVYFKNGLKRKVEFHHSTGYLSQSTRRLKIPLGVEKVYITDSKGNENQIFPRQ